MTRSMQRTRQPLIYALLLLSPFLVPSAWAAAGETPKKLFLRVTVHEPTAAALDVDALYVRSCFIAGRGARANLQSRQRLVPFEDRPGGRTGWFALPVKGGKVPYSGVTLYVGDTMRRNRLTEAEAELGRIEMEVELAIARDAASIRNPQSLRRIVSGGNGVPFYYRGGNLEGVPERARWLTDHLTDLRDALVEAGYDSAVKIDPGTMRLGIHLSASRFGAGAYGRLSRDSEMYALYGEIFALAGYNVGTRGHMRALYENHPQFSANMVEVAAISQDLPADYLPGGLRIPDAVDEKYRKRAERARRGDGLVPLWMKLGDEIGVRRYVDSPRARKILLREARIVTGDDPGVLGIEDWSELEPVTERRNPSNVAPEDRLRYYITVRARNILTAESFALRSAAIEKHFGSGPLTEVNMLGPMYYGGYSKRFWYRQTPDYFRMGDLRAVDVLQVHGLNSAYAPGGPLILALLSPKVTVQAAGRHPGVEPEMMHFAPRTPPESWPHVFFASLNSGVPHVDWYRFGPRASGWEWFDTEEKMLGHAALARQLQKVEPYLAEPGTPGEDARIGLLWAESSDLWHRHPNSYSKSELRSTFMALRFGGIPADFLREYMVEAGELDDYDILFVSQRNVNRRTQRAILEWVREGGRLVLTPGAMTRDEADRPSDLFAEALAPGIVWRADEGQPAASGEFSNFETLGDVRWTEGSGLIEVPAVFDAQVIAGEAEPIARWTKRGRLNLSPESHGGAARLIKGGIYRGAPWDAFNADGNAYTRCGNHPHIGDSSVLERVWNETVEIERIEVKAAAHKLKEFKVHYRDRRGGAWHELVHVADHGQYEYSHTLNEPIATSAMRFELIATNHIGAQLHEIRYLAARDDSADAPAIARRMELGRGTVTALGFFPGHAYATGSARSVRKAGVAQEGVEVGQFADAAGEGGDELVMGIVRTGSPYWMEPDPSARALLIGLVKEAGVEATTVVDAPTVDAGVHVRDDRAAILLANFQPRPRGDVRIETDLPERFRGASARTLDGEAVELEWLGEGRVGATVPLNTIEAILIDL